MNLGQPGAVAAKNFGARACDSFMAVAGRISPEAERAADFVWLKLMPPALGALGLKFTEHVADLQFAPSGPARDFTVFFWANAGPVLLGEMPCVSMPCACVKPTMPSQPSWQS
jgi:hypothetical protein